MKRLGRLIFAGLIVLLLLGGAVYWYLKSNLMRQNVALSEPFELLIPTGSGYQNVIDSFTAHKVLLDMLSFETTASLLKYKKDEVPSGRYLILPDMTNKAIISKLRAGRQDAVKLTFNNVRNVVELAGAIAAQLEVDSLSLLQSITDSNFVTEHSLNTETLLSLFIPNTYEIYWNTSTDKLLKRLAKEHDSFWDSSERKQQLQSLGMTREEVYTLASIVEKETNLREERPTLAAVYLNRIRLGMPLQADPTIVFAVGDFSIRRVLKKHLEIDSPYNTYLNIGLPPGPIYMPSINSIDAVLANKQHDYIFFCAKPGYNGGHAFAKTLKEHNQNANTYHNWLTSERIK